MRNYTESEMAPNGQVETVKQPECSEDIKKDGNLEENRGISKRQPLKVANIIGIVIVHYLAVWGLITQAPKVSWPTVIFYAIYGIAGGFGVTAGVHRLWAHRAYHAKLPFRIILALCFSIAGQNTIPEWVKDHRVHHKFSETDADPHNSKRGFFFAHVGWLMQKKHPMVLSKGKLIDISDVLNDPVVAFHTKYFTELKILLCFIVPVATACCCFGENFQVAFIGNIVRYVIGLNVTWLVNSAAHIYGNRPFNNQIRPAENLSVALLTLGEGWHNYHHVFPWDYKASELGGWDLYNPTTILLEKFAAWGLATDLKSPSKELIERVARKYGDGSHTQHNFVEVDENGVEITTSCQG